MNIHLQEVFSYDEMREAFQNLLKHSCLDMDDLALTFFLKYSDLIKVDLCTYYQQIFYHDYVPSHLQKD